MVSSLEEAKKLWEEAKEKVHQANREEAHAYATLCKEEENERARNFEPNATMKEDYFGLMHMNEENAKPELVKGESVHILFGKESWDNDTVTRSDGRQFSLPAGMVKMNG